MINVSKLFSNFEEFLKIEIFNKPLRIIKNLYQNLNNSNIADLIREGLRGSEEMQIPDNYFNFICVNRVNQIIFGSF